MELKKTIQQIEFRKHFLSELDYLNQSNHKIIVSYFGTITSDFTHQLIENLEYYLLERKFEPERIKKLYSSALHTLNNMYIYGKTDQENQKLISFFVTNQAGRFHIFSSNLIDLETEKFLTKHIDKINKLDIESLKNMYKNAVEKSFLSKEQNGIGIISMRYHSEELLKYSFKKAGDKLLFCLEMC